MDPIKNIEFKELLQLKNEEKYQKALNSITEYEKKKDIRPEEQILGLILKADIHRILGHYKDAINIADEAFEMSQKQENKQQVFDSLKIKIQTLLDYHRPIKAIELLDQLIIIFKLLKNISGSELMRREADLAYITGRIYFESGDYNQAEENFKTSLELREKVGDKAEIAENLVRLSYVFAKRADFSQALQGFEENLTLEGIREIDKCLVLAGMGAIYITKGELNRALICNKEWLEIARDIKNQSIEASALLEGGRIYMMKGNLKKALVISEQCLNLFESTGDIMERANLFFNLIRISTDLDSITVANRYLRLFKELVEKENNVHLTISYKLTHSLILKRSTNPHDRIEAENILKSLIEGDVYHNWHDFWEIETIIHLCDLLLMEYHESNNLEILDEIQPLLIKLKEATKNRNSMSRLAQTNLLLAQFALIKMNIGEARQCLIKAQQIAEKHGLYLLAQKISNEHDKLLEHLDKWENVKNKKAQMKERIKYDSIKETLDLLQQGVIRAPKLMDEEPTLLLVMAEGGIPAFSYSFTEDWSLEDEFFSGFLTAFNTFSEKIFSKGLDRAKFGDNTLIMDSVGSFSLCYLFKGQSYLAKHKLIQFAHRMRNTTSIWQVFEGFNKKPHPIVLSENPPLQSLITDIFLRSSSEIPTPLEINAVKKVSSKKPKTEGKLFYQNPDFIDFLTEELEKLDYVFIGSLKKSGAWAITYIIFHELTDENRLLKIYKVPVDESSKAVLVKQDKKLSQIEHENISKLFQSGYFKFNEQKIRYLIIEYFAKSKTLEELTPKVFQEKSLETRVDLAHTLIKTIKNIRKRGFTHGDLHEGNILISSENELKVIDPGFSKISQMHVDSDVEFIQSHFKRYFFSANEFKLAKFKLLTEKSRIQEILEILSQIKEDFPKKKLDKKGGKKKKKYELVYKDLLEEYPRLEKGKCRVGIAQIGLSKTEDIISEFFELRASNLVRLREDKVESIRAKVKYMIEKAYENSVNILLFPEMLIDLNYVQISDDIGEFAKKYEMYIIPGSYHDQKTMQNLSVVYGPDGILWEQRKHIPATITLDGKKIEEIIDVGSFPRKTIVCNTEFGRIAIVICRDFLDMDLRVELKNFEPPVDILLNPAFTPVMADFDAAHFDARRSIYAYCFFVNIAQIGESFIHTPEKERVERKIPSKEEGLIFKDLDIFKLREERKKWEKEEEKKFIQSTRQ